MEKENKNVSGHKNLMFNLRGEQQVKDAINWNALNREDTQLFWNQSIRQFWIDEEIPLSDDKLTWGMMSFEQKDAYTKIIAGLTLLDTEQGTLGTPQLAHAIEDLGVKSVLMYCSFMEHMHAKSYSSIFSTLCSTPEIDKLFEWVKEQPNLQKKVKLISDYYNNIKDDESLYMAMVASVFLENFLFYSGFFYPLYLAGMGKLVASGEIINLIIRDEVIHGTYIGRLAQDLYAKFDKATKDKLYVATKRLLLDLYANEVEFAKVIYDQLGLTQEVINYVQYNGDRALISLGFDKYFDIDITKVNPIVLSGIDTKTKNHDFFSTKGNGYIKATNIETVNDDDFDF